MNESYSYRLTATLLHHYSTSLISKREFINEVLNINSLSDTDIIDKMQTLKRKRSVYSDKLKISIEKYFGIDDLLIKTRKRTHLIPRYFYFYIRHLLGSGYSELERDTGWNHSSVLHAVRTFEKDIVTDCFLRMKLIDICEKLGVNHFLKDRLRELKSENKTIWVKQPKLRGLF
jgi:hypothetical protein